MALRMFTHSTMMLEDQKDPTWRQMLNPCTSWCNFSGTQIIMNGLPANSAVTVGYIERPTQMVNPADVPDTRMPDYYHPIIKYFAAYYLLMLAGPTQDRKKAGEMLEAGIALLAQSPEQQIASPEVKR